MPGGFEMLLGGEGKPSKGEDDGGDPERDAAIAALKRFRSAKSDDEALMAFKTLVRHCQGGEGHEMDDSDAPADEEY
jgi:hypothetical protein